MIINTTKDGDIITRVSNNVTLWSVTKDNGSVEFVDSRIVGKCVADGSVANAFILNNSVTVITFEMQYQPKIKFGYGVSIRKCWGHYIPMYKEHLMRAYDALKCKKRAQEDFTDAFDIKCRIASLDKMKKAGAIPGIYLVFNGSTVVGVIAESQIAGARCFLYLEDYNDFSFGAPALNAISSYYTNSIVVCYFYNSTFGAFEIPHELRRLGFKPMVMQSRRFSSKQNYYSYESPYVLYFTKYDDNFFVKRIEEFCLPSPNLSAWDKKEVEIRELNSKQLKALLQKPFNDTFGSNVLNGCFADGHDELPTFIGFHQPIPKDDFLYFTYTLPGGQVCKRDCKFICALYHGFVIGYVLLSLDCFYGDGYPTQRIAMCDVHEFFINLGILDTILENLHKFVFNGHKEVCFTKSYTGIEQTLNLNATCYKHLDKSLQIRERALI